MMNKTRKIKKFIYVSAPYRARTVTLVEKNINRAVQMGKIVYNKGHIPIVPHINSKAIFGVFDRYNKMITEFDLCLLSRCDEMWICTENITKGMQIEIDFCKKHKIPMSKKF